MWKSTTFLPYAIASLQLSACSTLIGNVPVHNAGSRGPAVSATLDITCATAAVVGLRWGAATDNSQIAGYRIVRDGVTIGTTTGTYFSDTSVAAATQYAYVIEAFDIAGNTTALRPLLVITTAAGVDGDAPYCPSTVISSMTWNWSTGYSQANGSDLWPTTWGSDDNVYAAFGDGGGFGGDNFRGRTSFGVAMFAGAPPPTSSSVWNVYGGLESSHPSLVDGKAGAIIAIGSDFYALAGIYGPTDSKTEYPDQPSSAPNHTEIAYSLGNAYSWRDNAWTFCGADSSGQQEHGSFCPLGFVQFGPGNDGAPDRYLYLYGTDPATTWNAGAKRPPLNTYLARVPTAQILRASAYEFFAGLDSKGKTIWSSDPNRMLPVFTDRNANQRGCSGVCNMAGALREAVYNRSLKRYLGIAQGDYVSQTSFYDAPTPWGPWTVISYNNIHAASGEGGWANLGIAGGSSLGVHPVNAWTSSSGLTMWMTYSGGGKAPPGSLFPPVGTSLDSLNLLSVQLNLAVTQ